MTKRYPVPYIVKKEVSKLSKSTFDKVGKEIVPSGRKEKLEAIKLKLLSKKKK